ncbi:MAG TPA: hypothetical protein VGS09_07130 [Actinomycetota bacterium]|nr:hypothetical protein [Actinomycetota bacterium]
MAKRKRSTRTAPRPKPTGSGPATDGPATKAERRNQARQERHALQRKMERRRRLRGLTTRVVVVLAVLGVTGGVLLLTRSRSPKTGPINVSGAPSVDPASLPGILTGPAPWPANTEDLEARLSAIGLPALSAEGTELHIHQHLDLYVNGTKQVVPAQIGIVTSPQVVFSPLHTHDTSGIIHVESPTVRSFTLGEFFDVWGVRFTPTCVGGYCNQGDKTLRVYVDGQLATGDPTSLELFAHEEIVVTYGTEAQLPLPIPSSYTFPPGL